MYPTRYFTYYTQTHTSDVIETTKYHSMRRRKTHYATRSKTHYRKHRLFVQKKTKLPSPKMDTRSNFNSHSNKRVTSNSLLVHDDYNTLSTLLGGIILPSYNLQHYSKQKHQQKGEQKYENRNYRTWRRKHRLRMGK